MCAFLSAAIRDSTGLKYFDRRKISLAGKRDVINISKLMSFSMFMQTEELIGEGLFCKRTSSFVSRLRQ